MDRLGKDEYCICTETYTRLIKICIPHIREWGKASDQDDRDIKAPPTPTQSLTLPCFCLEGINLAFVWLSHICSAGITLPSTSPRMPMLTLKSKISSHVGCSHITSKFLT